jgi:2-dehydro-3-deoxygalactonokinase
MSGEPVPVMISADWGTTALRLYLLAADGSVLDRRMSQQGLMAVAKDQFAAVLLGHCGDWTHKFGPLPALLSGMVGSRQGWVEAPYVSCPAGLEELATRLTAVAVPGIASVHIVAGVDTTDHDGIPDVMRGEECQIIGALALLGLSSGTFILPGTHSKWVTVGSGKIISFQTFMTGEIFAALKSHTILGRMMDQAAASQGDEMGDAFAQGIETAAKAKGPGAWLHRLFSVRTLGLMGRLADKDAADYLSGLMIGWEMASVAPNSNDPVVLIGGRTLTKRYLRAAELRNIATKEAPEDCVCAGHVQIARAARIV